MDTKPEFSTNKEIIAFLSTTFPHCFTLEGDAKPLKVGIFQDIVQALSGDGIISNKKIRVALRAYTTSWRYLYSIKEGVSRVDLQGNPCQVISADEALHAKTTLDESKAKVKEQQKLAHQAKKAAEKPKRPAQKQVANVKPIKKVSVEQLQVGQNVHFSLGTKKTPAIITAIEKENIKVRVQSGMEITITTQQIIL